LTVRRFVVGIRMRITLAAVAVVAVALALGAALLLQQQRRQLTDDIETTARLRASDIASTLEDGTLPQDLSVAQQDANVIQVVDANGRVVAASTNIAGQSRITNLVPPPDGVATVTTHDLPVGDSDFRVVALQTTSTRGSYVVYVASSLQPVDNSVDTLSRLLALGLPVLLLGVGFGTWFIVGRALGEVEAIRREVETISDRDLHRRVPEPQPRDEIGRLARTMNAMLGRLEEATERQQRFVGDASHELRNPLTSIRAQLEVDLAHPSSADWKMTHTSVLDETMRMQRLVDDLLILARLDHGTACLRRDPVDLDDILLREAIRARQAGGVDIGTSGVSGGQVVGDVDQLTRAARNLLDNAVRHATSKVEINLAETDATVELTVTDDGPGVPAEQAIRIFDRFARIDDARSRDDGGTGLGLAITREIILAHGGTIAVEDAHPGARFVVCLPTASEPRHSPASRAPRVQAS
jgi:signal transduction histidine kinase